REMAELCTVIDQVTDDQIALIAGSFGGPLATCYAARYPEVVARLVLYGTFAVGTQIASAPVQQAMVGLLRAHWRLGAKTLTGILAPGVSDDEARRFTRSQYASVSAEAASDLLCLFYGM